jgi:hypothetical protein
MDVFATEVIRLLPNTTLTYASLQLSMAHPERGTPYHLFDRLLGATNIQHLDKRHYKPELYVARKAKVLIKASIWANRGNFAATIMATLCGIRCPATVLCPYAVAHLPLYQSGIVLPANTQEVQLIEYLPEWRDWDPKVDVADPREFGKLLAFDFLIDNSDRFEGIYLYLSITYGPAEEGEEKEKEANPEQELYASNGVNEGNFGIVDGQLYAIDMDGVKKSFLRDIYLLGDEGGLRLVFDWLAYDYLKLPEAGRQELVASFFHWSRVWNADPLIQEALRLLDESSN